MKHVLYALLTAVSILFTSCGPSSNTNNPQVPNVPQPQPQPGPDMDTTVYVTKSGSKYHYDWCPSLNRSKNLTPMKASDAYNSGYAACKVCKPPTW